MEEVTTVKPPLPTLNDLPQVNPPFPLPPMSIAQLQALSFMGFLPNPNAPFPMNFFPPGFVPPFPLDMSKTGYEPNVNPGLNSPSGSPGLPTSSQSPPGGATMTETPDDNQDAEMEEDLQQQDINSNITKTTDLGPRQSLSPGIEQTNIDRKPIQDRVRQKRQTLQDMTRPLKQWLYSHRDNPYPNKTEKVQLARSSQMTLTQVSNWFANARRRLKNTVRGPEMTWAKRIKLYNNYVEGNQELLSVGSSSSDDEMTEIPENVRIVTGEGSTISQEDMISDHSALDAQQVAPEVLPPPVHSPNLQDRLLGRDVPAPAVAHQFGSHTTITPPSFSALSQPTAPTDPRQMPTHPQNPAPQPTDFRDPSTTGNTKLLSGSDTWGPPVEDIEPHAPKYKHSIMQRYLNDSYTFQSAMQALGSPERDPKEKERHRNPSGSLSSHDYEEYMSSASSSRSTPTREHQDSHIDEYEEFSRHWPDIKTRAEDDLYWKEISAALALTSLARSKYQAHHPTA